MVITSSIEGGCTHFHLLAIARFITRKIWIMADLVLGGQWCDSMTNKTVWGVGRKDGMCDRGDKTSYFWLKSWEFRAVPPYGKNRSVLTTVPLTVWRDGRICEPAWHMSNTSYEIFFCAASQWDMQWETAYGCEGMIPLWAGISLISPLLKDWAGACKSRLFF